jgi:hypothetical protein
MNAFTHPSGVLAVILVRSILLAEPVNASSAVVLKATSRPTPSTCAGSGDAST